MKDRTLKYIIMLFIIALIFGLGISFIHPLKRYMTAVDNTTVMKDVNVTDTIKDVYINETLNTIPVVWMYGNFDESEAWVITYDSIRINIHHKFTVDYKREESWNYYATYKDGSDCMLQSVFDDKCLDIMKTDKENVKDYIKLNQTIH